MSIRQNIEYNITRLYFFLCLLIVTLIFIIAPSIARAHKVNIFAFAEDDSIVTESYFNDGSPCKESMIQVYDLDGHELLQGKTDEEGIFSFKVPKRTDLRIVLTASMGHKAEYKMPASEIPDILSQKAEGKVPFLTLKGEKDEEMPSKNVDQNIGDNTAMPTVISVDMDQLRSVIESAIDQAIEKKMKPLMHAMVKSQSNRVSLPDILGGIGYIFGIMGLIFYFKKR